MVLSYSKEEIIQLRCYGLLASCTIANAKYAFYYKRGHQQKRRKRPRGGKKIKIIKYGRSIRGNLSNKSCMTIPLCEVLAIKAEANHRTSNVHVPRSNEIEMQPCKALKRPKNLLVFINPVGGRKMAKKIYKDKVGPLFDLAGIVQEVIVTEYANHAYDYLLNKEIQNYDGIVSVGGDGMASEIVNGVLRRHHKSNQISEDSTEDHQSGISSTKPFQTVGLIPAGSTDTIAFCTSGINDATTCALHIIVGDRVSVDVCSVWNDGKFLKYCISMAGYGFMGDVIQESEKLRWMGPHRYDFAGFKTFLSNRAYRGDVMYIPASDGSSPLSSKRCFAGCERCKEEHKPDIHKSDQWESVTDSFISIVGANLTCRCAKAVSGISPHAHLGDGCMDLILIRKTSRAQYFKQMHSMAYKGDPFSFNFVNAIRVKEFKFRLHENENGMNGEIENEKYADSFVDLASIGIWNVDGELVDKACLHFRTHRQLIKVFGRGVEEIEESAGCKPFRKKHHVDESSL